jgi:tetratricopeptide (TPR) repeat protein
MALVAASGCDTLSARHRASEGAELFRKGDLRGAVGKYEQAAKLDPSIDALQLNLAFLYSQLYSASPRSGDGIAYGGLAVQAFEEYLRRRPGDPTARNHLVQTFVDTGRYDDAVAYFRAHRRFELHISPGGTKTFRRTMADKDRLFQLRPVAG